MQHAVRIAAGATFQHRYQVQAEIGSGGFATVYRAKQLATGQSVAIKVLHWQERHGSNSDRELARFLREMRLCALLHHPNIVRLIDSGQSEGGALYTVFEFVPGQNLADVLVQEGPLAPVEARHLMLQVLDALACAHAKGIVHRDLKPHNIMVTTGVRRNALVLDFGIGAIASPEHPGESLTLTGEMLGSPRYAAPEQFVRGPPTPLSDLFSWALVFLESLTGMDASAPGTQALVMRRLDSEPVALPAALAEHPLGAILRRALVKDVAARAVTAEALLRDLEACDVRDVPRLAERPSRAEPPVTRPYPLAAGPWVKDKDKDAALERAAGSRGIVSVVACKLDVRATSARLDEADAQLDLMQQVIGDVAHRRGGCVVSASSDVVVVCFGHPVARADDAVRAVRAAIAMGAALWELQGPSEGVTASDVAIGIHTGPVVVRESEDPLAALGPVVGLTIRLAIDLARRAVSGEILVSAETGWLTQDHFDYGTVKPLALEGRYTGVRVLSLPGQDGAEVGTRSWRRTPLLGRDQELALVDALSDGARRGEGRSILVAGESGVGKSRFLDEVTRRMERDGFAVLRARCGPETTHSPFYPFIDLLHRLLRHDYRRPTTTLRRLEASILAHGLEPRDALPPLARLLGLRAALAHGGSQATPWKLKDAADQALVSLLTRMAEARPLVLLVEDIQWCDSATRETLASLSAAASSFPLLVMMSARGDLGPSSMVPCSRLVPLARLGPRDVADLVAQRQKTPVQASVVDRVLQRSGGNPLLVEELVSRWEHGSAEGEMHGREVEVIAASSEECISEMVRDCVEVRLTKLGSVRPVAEAAAVMGTEFRFDVLTALVGRPESEVKGDLEVLADTDIVRGGRSLEGTCRFKHALVREAVYRLTEASSRAELHSRLARVLETRFGEVAESRPELLARHHAAANELGAAIAYAQRAAVNGFQRGGTDEVIASVQMALSWLSAVTNGIQREAVERELNELLTMVWRAARTPAEDRPPPSVSIVVASGSDSTQIKESPRAAGLLFRRRRRGPTP